MKVLIISDNPQGNTGYGKLTKVWMQHLVKQGHEVLIQGGVSPNSRLPFEPVEWEGAKIWYVPGYGHQEHIRYFLDKEKPDIVLANSDPRFFDYLFKMDNEIRRQCPLVFYHLWDDFPFPDFNLPYYLSCDKLICGSKFTHDLMKGNSEIIARNFLSYVPIGIDLDIYKPLPIEEKDKFWKEFNDFTNNRYTSAKFIVGVVGRFAERKQLLSILESFTRWAKNKPDALLFIHSPGSDQGNALGYVMRMRYKDAKIVYSNASPSKQTDELINKFYNFFDVLVNRSNAEGFGLPIAEAMAAGIPCISIDNAGPAALITSETGWLLKADCTPMFGNQITPYIQTRYVTDKKFEDALDAAYNNRKDRDEKASKCRDYIDKNYNQKDMVVGIEKALLMTISNFKPYPEYTITTWPNIQKSLNMKDILEKAVT